MIVRANIKFGLHSSFLDRGFEAEDERLPRESIEDGVLRVEAALKRAEDILRQKVSAKGDSIPQVQTVVLTQEINIQHERIEIAIENATTIDELKDVKSVYPLMPVKCREAYNLKLKQLTNV